MTERNYAIDFIRLASIIGVVVIHTSTYYIDRTPPFSFNFYILHAVNQVFRFAVPAFFGISGFLLALKYSNIESPLKFYKKRFSRILVPYLIWTLFYFLIIFPNPIKLVLSRIFLNDLITGDASYQLYFIPAIIVLYLLFPLIVYFKKIFLTKWFIVFLGVIEIIILSYVYFYEPKISIISPLPLGFYNLLPFVLGIYSATRIKDFKRFVINNKIMFWMVSITSVLVIYFESIFMFHKTGKPMYLRDQWRPSVYAYGPATAGIIYYKYQDRWNKVVSYLSGFTFGVFFVHAAILHNLLIIFYKYKLYGLTSFVVSLTITIALSFLFCIVLSRVKLVNNILGLRGT